MKGGEIVGGKTGKRGEEEIGGRDKMRGGRNK